MVTEDKSFGEQLKNIEEKLKAIEGKLSEKWFLPVFITVLTTFLALISFFIQRKFTNADIRENKQSEIIGQFVADSKVKFYTECKQHLDAIDEQFESFCKIGHSRPVGDQLDSSLINFRRFILKQQVIDQSVIEPVRKYSEFVSESAFDISSGNLGKQESMRYYDESEALLNVASKTLDNGIQQIINQ